jgi:hypothetical protein
MHILAAYQIWEELRNSFLSSGLPAVAKKKLHVGIDSLSEM